MDKIELLELINKGESSFVEFKADTPDREHYPFLHENV